MKAMREFVENFILSYNSFERFQAENSYLKSFHIIKCGMLKKSKKNFPYALQKRRVSRTS